MSDEVISHYVVDIESTGEGMFAFGIAWCTDDIKKAECRQISLQLRTLEEIQNKASWEEVWRNHGFDERTFSEFWSKHVNVLYALQDPKDPCVVNTFREFVAAMHDFINEAETTRGAKRCMLWVDTVTTDTVEISNALASQGFPLFRHTRQGEYRNGMEIDSYIKGLLNCSPTIPDGEFKRLEERHLKPLWKINVPHDHSPEHDALYNLQRVMAAIQYQGMHDLTKKKAFLLVFFGFLLSLLFSSIVRLFF